MNFFGDYHTHTYYSDGISSCRENVLAAIDKGLKVLAFTDHGYGNPKRFAMTPEKHRKQRKELDLLRAEFGDRLEIIQGIEADLIALDGTIDLSEADYADMDVVVMGYHSFARAKSFYDWRKIYFNSYLRIIKYPSKEVIDRNTKAMINGIKNNRVDILAHINHLFKVDCYEVAKAAGDYGTYIELNEKHFDFSHETFEKMLTTDCKFIVNSDAHHWHNIGVFDSVKDFLASHSFDPNRVVNLNKMAVFLRK